MKNPLNFLGICLRGAKSHHTVALSLEYFEVSKKIFLREIFDIHSTQEMENLGDYKDADLWLRKIIDQQNNLQCVSINAPLSLPSAFIEGSLKKTQLESRLQTEMNWVKEQRIQQTYLPYLQRPCEVYLNHLFATQDLEPALGANLAPLAARALYLRSFYPQQKWLETYPKINLRIWHKVFGTDSDIGKHFNHFEKGPEARKLVLLRMRELGFCFIYEADFDLLSESKYHFQAFFIACQGLLEPWNLQEPYPLNFPVKENISFPGLNLSWESLRKFLNVVND